MGDGRARIYREKLGKRTVGRWGRFFGGVGRSLTRARLEGIFETDFDFFYNCFLGVMSWHLTTKHTTPQQGITQIRYPTPLISFWLKYQSVPEILVSTDQYRTFFKFYFFPFKYQTIPVGVGLY